MGATWAAFVLGVAVHLPWWARSPTEWDSVQLVLGVRSFDVTQASPHAPGYWLAVATARLVQALTPLDGHASLVACSALAAGASVALAFVLGRDMAGRWLGLAAAGVMATSPFVLFYGSTAATYAFDALAVEVLLVLAWRARPGSWHGTGAAAALALAGGFRQSSLLLLAPVAVVAVVRSRPTPRRLAAAAGAGVAGLAAWLVPMAVDQPGGLGAVQRAGGRIWREAVSVTSPLYGAPAEGIRYNLGQAAGYTLAAVAFLLPATALALVLRFRARRADPEPGRPAPGARGPGPGGPGLLAVAALPPLAFVLVFHFGKAGYVLSYLPPLVLLALWPAARLGARPRALVGVVVALACALQLQRFVVAPGILPLAVTDRGGPWFTQSRFGAPYRLTAAAIRDVDADVERGRALGWTFDPARDVLVYVYLDGGHRFRHAMLTLPDFTTHYLQAGRDEYVGRRYRWRRERDRTVELPPGGRAVFVVDELQGGLGDLVADGRARPVVLDSGPTVYVVGAGPRVFGVELAEDPGPAATPR